MRNIICKFVEYKRLPFFKIKNSRWLQGIKWPLSDEKYRALPRSSFRNALLVDCDTNSCDTGNTQNGNNDIINGKHNVTKNEPQNAFGSNELIVRNEMEGLGISSELINSHIERGARSPIIGTYRVLLHR